jgi:glycolate oxidase FAD binding subunit
MAAADGRCADGRRGAPVGLRDTMTDTVAPQVVQPATAADLSAVLADASRDRRAMMLRGGGTKSDWGRTPAALDLIVSTAGLTARLEHRAGDLTVTAGAGVPLASLHATLARHGQWLPLDSAFEGATIGGIVATNDAGPLRHRYGTPRDLLIGTTLALTDGRIVKAGGHVVKNVAGYDLGRLVSGSFGSLAAIVDATFKLLPVPQASATLVATFSDPESLARAAGAIVGSQIEPAAVDVHLPASGLPCRLLVRCASSPAATRAQADAAEALVRAPSILATGADEAALWRAQVEDPWAGEGSVIRFSWLPARLAKVAACIGQIREATGAAIDVWGRVRAGAGLARVTGSADAQIDVVTRLRAAEGIAAHVVVLRAQPEVRDRVDVWGPPLPAAHVLRALKQSLDPMGVLNAGRGPL